MSPAKPTPAGVEAKLDEIIEHLRKLDERDKLRMWGGFFKGMIALIPVVLLLWSAWYFVNHGAELMKMIANQAASSAAEYTKNQSSSMFDDFMKEYSVPSGTKK